MVASRIAPLVAVAALSAGTAFAQTETLNFSAVIQSDINPWLENECPTCGINTAAVGTDITGTVVLSSALPANGTTTVAATAGETAATAIYATSVMFSGPNDTAFSLSLPGAASGAAFVNGVPLTGSYDFTFVTVNDVITAYSFSAGTFRPDAGGAAVAGSSAGTVAQSSPGACGYCLVSSNYTVTASGGTWVDPPSGGGALAAPEIDPAGTIGALTLLLGFLAIVKGRHA